MATASELAALGLMGTGTAGLTYLANDVTAGDGEGQGRTLANTAGNLGGGYAGYALGGMSGNPYVQAASTVAGALGGGYISDRLVDTFAPREQLRRISPTELLNVHLENDPIAQQAMYQEKIRQARLMEKEMLRQRMLQYQAQMAQQQGA